jgi:hypothetical protein
MAFGNLNRRHLMVHAALANKASPLIGNGLERILNASRTTRSFPNEMTLLSNLVT